MLAQLLERDGYSAIAIPIGSVDGMLAEAANAEPEIVCLSALPPYAISHCPQYLQKTAHAASPNSRSIIGLWNYSEDPVKAATEIQRRRAEISVHYIGSKLFCRPAWHRVHLRCPK